MSYIWTDTTKIKYPLFAPLFRMNWTKVLLLLLVLLVSTLFLPSALSQLSSADAAIVTGRVLDPVSKPVQYVAIIVDDKEVTSTDINGNFSFLIAPKADGYTVEYYRDGIRIAVIETGPLTANQTTDLGVFIQPAMDNALLCVVATVVVVMVIILWITFMKKGTRLEEDDMVPEESDSEGELQ